MPVIDFHSHLLPGIDDGSRNLDITLEILDTAERQGVEWMIATPHFYASKDRIESFCDRREDAYERMKEQMHPGMPKVLRGAEVAFFPGISSAEKLDYLTVEGTDVLLLELPFDVWGSTVVEEVRYLLEQRHFSVVLAHPERYLDIPGNKRKLQSLLEMPIIVQINAGSLLDWKRRRKIFRFFCREHRAEMVLGSDCHGIHRRPPNLGEGRTLVKKKKGQDFLDQVDLTGNRLLHLVQPDKVGNIQI